MGTRTKGRRGRHASRRGLASFVSFVLLFAFALGQGSSWIALADDAGTDPPATENTVTDGVSGDAALPVAEAPAEEAPAEEALAAEEGTDDAEGSPDGGAASASRSTPRTTKLNTARADRDAPTEALAAPPGGGLEGGDIDLDFAAAGPFTYNHATGLGAYPTYGFNDGHISKNDGVVESLEGGDFECGDLVAFFTEVTVNGSAGGQGDIELDYSFGAETTGQPGVGFDDIVSVGMNTPDEGNDNLDGDEAVTLVSETADPPGNQAGYDQVLGTVRVTNLDAGEVLIVRLIVHLACQIGNPTGNILNAIEDARVIDPKADDISVGQQTVPMKQVGDVARPGLSVDKSCPAFGQVGETITYSISIENTGNETLNITSVVDTVNSHAPANITASFPATVAAGATVTRTYQYTVLAGDPDPLPNSVTVTAQGGVSQVTLTGSASCETDILKPKINVTKSCTTFAQVGDTITYTITVTNSGDENLKDITVEDSLLGSLSGSFADTLAAGASESHAFTYVVTAQSPDPVPNEVTATGKGVTSSDVVDDSASCSTDITHTPGIDITKSCPRSAGVGDVITYTITITNTGDEALENITVNDSILGDVSSEFPNTLAVDGDFTAFIDYTVTTQSQDPIHNVVTVSGFGTDSEDEATDEAFCDTDVEHPAIEIVKDGPSLVHRGDTITYDFVVTNIGDVDLFDVVLTDPICDGGTITLVDDGDGDSVLAVEETWSYTCTRFVTDDDPDPIPNTGTVRGDTSEGQEGGEEVTDSDDHVVDLIHPGIDIVKTVDEDIVPIGTTVTYTYVITNTGDTTLYDISVDDDILGHIGDIEFLEPGGSVTLTRNFVVGNRIVTNVGTVEGGDILGRSVSADDDATVTPIAGANPPAPNDPPTPFTGSDAGRLGLITMVLFGIGVTVVASTRRRRPECEAA